MLITALTLYTVHTKTIPTTDLISHAVARLTSLTHDSDRQQEFLSQQTKNSIRENARPMK